MTRPRIRTLKPELWQDEAVGEVSRDARLLFVGLITQADDKGRLRGDPRLIAAQLFPYDAPPPEQVEAWLAELDRVGLIQRYAHAGRPLICLPAWERHQKINRASEKVLPGPDDEGSVDFHGSFTDGSSPEGKGSEGSGEESEADASDVVPSGSSSPALAAKEEPQRSKLPTGGRLSELLADLVAANDPDGKRPKVSTRWLDAERLLASRASSGERAAYGQLYEAYVDKIYRYIYYKVGQRAEALLARGAAIESDAVELAS